MTNNPFNVEIRETKICECRCHMDGLNGRHIAACCRLTYQKYISTNGDVDVVRWAKLEHDRKNNVQ